MPPSAASSGRRVAVLTGTFHPEVGGPPTYLYYLLPGLRDAGHTVRLVTFGEPSASDDQYGYAVQRISRSGGLLARQARLLRALWGLTRGADVLFIMGYVLPLPLLRLFFRGRVVAKIVSDFTWEYADRTGRTTLDVNAFQTARLPVPLRLLRAYYRWCVRLADAVIVPSGHVARLVIGWGVPADRVQVIHNALPPISLHETPRADLRAALGLPLSTPLLVSVARLTPVKGVDVALHALTCLPNAHFVVVGDGPQQVELAALAQALGIAARVTFTGRQPHDTVQRYLRAADVFVLSSRTEGLSHVLLEALACATPAVATAVGGNPEILTDGVNGLLVPSEDAEALAAAVRRVLADSALAQQLAAAGYARSRDFSWDATLKRTLAVLTGDNEASM